MMNIKGGTQTWSTAEQVSSLKADQAQILGAHQREKALGASDDLGEVLNKISDPNWVDPSKQRKVGNSELGKDAFLKLLLAQLKNQDPTSPMESHEMAAQLAQFSSLEKLQNIETNLGEMAKGKESDGVFEALNLIGKAVEGDSTQIVRSDNTESHDINFKLSGDAQLVTLNIKSKSGDLVRTLEARDLKQGQNLVSWNGSNDEGATMDKGEYRVEIEARNSIGQKIGAETKFSGVITGVNYTPEGPVLMMGKQKVRIKDIKTILSADQIATANSAKVTNEVEKRDGQVVKAPESQIDQSVAMSREMLNKLSKETETK